MSLYNQPNKSLDSQIPNRSGRRHSKMKLKNKKHTISRVKDYLKRWWTNVSNLQENIQFAIIYGMLNNKYIRK